MTIKTTQEPVIDATLFRIDQLQPFFRKLHSYRDEQMVLSFPHDFWLEMRKPSFAPNDGYIGDNSYVASRVMSEGYDNPLSYLYNLARLFDTRSVRVQAYNNIDLELEPIEPLSTDDLMLKLVGFADNRKRQSRGIDMLNTARIWRVEQLLGLTDWINSYRDKTLELCVQSSTKACVKLEKPESCGEMYPGDCRYDVTGKSHFNIFERIAGLFSNAPVTVEVRNVPKNPMYSPVPPIQLETFIVNCARYDTLL